jgi:4-amino-4-deoxy-L-arabinose transferase-like glycosyltransferase
MPPRPIRTIAPETEHERVWRWTLWSVFLVTVAQLIWLSLDRTDLAPAEAQLWLLAQAPAANFPTDTPLMVWLVWLTTKLLGDTGPAVRVAAPLLHFAAALVVYGCARRFYGERSGFWSAILFVTLPVISFYSTMLTSEPALALAWVLALYGLLRLRASGDRSWGLLIAGAILGGLLSGYGAGAWPLVTAPVAIAASICAVGWLRAWKRDEIVMALVALSIVLSLLLGAGPARLAAIAGFELPASYDLFSATQGWRRVGRAVSAQLAQHPDAILMADDQSLRAELVFYADPHPVHALAWPDRDAPPEASFYLGGNFLVVSEHPELLPRMLARFSEVGEAQTITIFLGASRAPLRFAADYVKGFKGFPERD